MSSGEECDRAFEDELRELRARVAELERELADAGEQMRRRQATVRALAEDSPDSVARFDRGCRYLYVNTSAARLTGLPPEEIVGRTNGELSMPDLWTGSLEQSARQVFETGELLKTEDSFPAPSGIRFFSTRWVPERAPDGTVISVLAVSRDITERKRARQERDITIEFLRIVSESTGTRDLIRAATIFFQRQSGCQAVGVRLQDEEDYPYFEARGFPDEFVQHERSLCLRNADGTPVRDRSGNPVLECMCGNVIRGRFDPAKPFFTGRGSFWTNSTTELLGSTTEADRQARTRNRCHGEGYESVALMPLQFGEQRLGLLQLNDRRKGMFSAETIDLWERLAGHLAVALAKCSTEEALREAHDRLNLHVDHSPLAVVEWDSEFRITRWAGEAERVFGWTAGEVLGKRIDEVPWDYEEDSYLVNQVMADMLSGKRPSNVNRNRNIRKDGSVIHCEWYNTSIRDASGRLVSVLSQVLDVTVRKQAEDALRNSEARLRTLSDNLPEGAIYRYCDNRERRPHFEFISAGIERLTGVPANEVLRDAAVLREITLPEDVERVLEAERLSRELLTPFEIEVRIRHRATGEVRWSLLRSMPSRRPDGSTVWNGVQINITDRKRVEERLRQTQKLESVGLLAGGIAHDFNNLLVGVIGNASLARDMLRSGDPVIKLLDQIVKSGEQAAHLTRQMLAYSGKGQFLIERLNLSELILEMHGLVQPSVSKKIAFQLDLANDLPPIEADRGQVQQVFMNLALNAAEAIGGGPGLISISTRVQEVGERTVRCDIDAGELGPGKYVCLEVCDSGCGMDEATKARIFDPFFSTKFNGRGLGLAVVAGIVRGHKGAVRVSSTQGQGSCFSVLFPASRHEITTQRGKSAQKTALQGTGTVLVVDDEEVVREIARESLERYGYTVLVADSGLAAIDIFKRHPGEIAVVVLDLSMPGMSGEEVLPELRKIRPAVPIVVSSGYSESETMKLFPNHTVRGFVQKPYTATRLVEKVKSTCS